MKSILFFAILAAWPLALLADEPVRTVQEELRRRNIYFGDVDGRRTPEFEEALKRYQKRKGLQVTGAEDHDTLRSLKLVGREAGEAAPRELSWPDEPVLKSDAKIDIAREAVEIGAETGVAPASVAPVFIAEAPKENRLKQASPIAKRSLKNDRPSGVRGGTLQQFTPREMHGFVTGYLRAISRQSLSDELRFYADQVDYFNNGRVDRRIVERTLRSYYQRWPKRSFSLGKSLEFRPDPNRGEIVITYEMTFTLKGSRGVVRGKTANEIVINAATADPRIVKIQERRIRT